MCPYSTWVSHAVSTAYQPETPVTKIINLDQTMPTFDEEYKLNVFDNGISETGSSNMSRKLKHRIFMIMVMSK